MTPEEKQLLLKVLCEGLPYGVKVYLKQTGSNQKEYSEIELIPEYIYTIGTSIIKPYLRPMSSMTEEEFIKLTTATELQYNQLELVEWDNNCKTLEFYLSEIPHYCVIKVFDWLNAHHFDYRDLIPMGLALEAPEDMYK